MQPHLSRTRSRILVGFMLLLQLLPVAFAGISGNLVPNPSFELAKAGRYPRGGRYYSCYSVLGYPLAGWIMPDAFNDDIENWASAEKHPNAPHITSTGPTPDWQDYNSPGDTYKGDWYTTRAPLNLLSPRFVVLTGGKRPGGDDCDEGVRVGLGPLDAGKYVLRARMGMYLTQDTTTVKVWLTKWSTHWFSSKQDNVKFHVGDLTLPPNIFRMWTCTLFSKTIDFEIPTDQQGVLSNLVLSCETGTAFIDDVELCKWCPEQMLLQDRIHSMSEPWYEAKTIRAGRNVDPAQTNGDVLLRSDAVVMYKAVKEVALLPGFRVIGGGRFRARIADCGTSGFDTPADRDTSVCLTAGASTVFRIGGNYRRGLSYLWTADPPAALAYLSSPSSPNPTVTIPGSTTLLTITYTLTVKDNNGTPVCLPTKTVIHCWPKDKVCENNLISATKVGQQIQFKFSLSYFASRAMVHVASNYVNGPTYDYLLTAGVDWPLPTTTSNVLVTFTTPALLAGTQWDVSVDAWYFCTEGRVQSASLTVQL